MQKYRNLNTYTIKKRRSMKIISKNLRKIYSFIDFYVFDIAQVESTSPDS